ncbi:MAG: GNAT family N-acetyltransferase [Oscillospiraceae bacterium]|nr:GNAT family N-acetyltransferase [Oscillospiraceae bacterium]
MSEIQCRRATPADVPMLTDVRMDYFLKDAYDHLTGEQARILRAGVADSLARHIGADCHGYLAVDGDKAVSCVLMTVYEKPANLTAPNGRFAEILGVYTRAAHRGQGLATRLMELALEDAAGLDLSYVELGASEMGAGLYRRLGFVDTPSEYLPMRFKFTR